MRTCIASRHGTEASLAPLSGGTERRPSKSKQRLCLLLFVRIGAVEGEGDRRPEKVLFKRKLAILVVG